MPSSRARSMMRVRVLLGRLRTEVHGAEAEAADGQAGAAEVRVVHAAQSAGRSPARLQPAQHPVHGLGVEPAPLQLREQRAGAVSAFGSASAAATGEPAAQRERRRPLRVRVDAGERGRDGLVVDAPRAQLGGDLDAAVPGAPAARRERGGQRGVVDVAERAIAAVACAAACSEKPRRCSRCCSAARRLRGAAQDAQRRLLGGARRVGVVGRRRRGPIAGAARIAHRLSRRRPVAPSR